MKTRPILFSGPMVNAILDGRKTQTRRVMKPQPVTINSAHATWEGELANIHGDVARFWKCPYGQPGDQLWVRETFRFDGIDRKIGVRDKRTDTLQYRADEDDRHVAWCPSIFMPRWASRLTLEITHVRVERLKNISEEDALDEGVYTQLPGSLAGMPEMQKLDGGSFYYHPDMHAAICDYRELWESINGAGSWSTNPFVWAINFRRT